METSEKDVFTLLIRGMYHAKPGRSSPKAGKYYRIINDVYDNENKRVKEFYQCMKCKEVLKQNPSNGTKRLNTHANICDPLPECK